MVSSVDSDSLSECPCLLTLLLDLPTVLSLQWIFVWICVTYISGMFGLVIFDLLLEGCVC